MKKPTSKKRNSGNQYDSVFRENIESIFLPLIERYLNIKIKHKKALPEKKVSTIAREVDTLYEIETTNGEKFVLHLEVQTRNDKNMVYRVGEYHSFDLTKYRLHIVHIVLYLGETPSIMVSTLPPEEVYTGFQLLSLRDMNVEQLLASKIPEEVLLAILAKYDKKESNHIITAILLQLEKICKDDVRIKKYTNQLTILSKLRNLEPETVTKIKDMPQLFDIRTSILFKEGLEKGHQEGREEGREEGRGKNQLLMIANMLTKTDISLEQIADLSEVSIAFVQHIKENLASDKWKHPDLWTAEQWENYFKK